MSDNKFVLKQAHLARRLNLKDILATRFENDNAKMATALGKSVEQCINITRQQSPTAIGENLAAEIEMALGLEKGQLSLLDGKDPVFYPPTRAELLVELIQKAKAHYADMRDKDLIDALAKELTNTKTQVTLASVRYNAARNILNNLCDGKMVVFSEKVERSSAQISNVLRDAPSAQIGNSLKESIESSFGLGDGYLDQIDGVYIYDSIPYLAQEMVSHLRALDKHNSNPELNAMAADILKAVDTRFLNKLNAKLLNRE
jgi:hypothetical protein